MDCKICGAKNIMPSVGGVDICGACDCGGMSEVCGKKYIRLDYLKSYGYISREECVNSHASLLEENEQLKTVLECWHKVFGTTQLTHAEDRLNVAERQVKSLLEKNKRLVELLRWLFTNSNILGRNPKVVEEINQVLTEDGGEQ